METPQKHRLTSRERRIVIGVAVFMAILFALWLLMVVLMMPEPSHGIV